LKATSIARNLVLGCAIVLAGLVQISNGGQKPREPLSEKEVTDLLKGGVPPSRVETLARQYGVSFESTQRTEDHLRQAKAPDSLLKALRELAPKAPAPSPPAPTTGVVVIDAAPGQAQVYMDDEPRGTTSREGLLRVSHLSPGEHKVRLSLTGYSDVDRSVQVSAGETVRFLVSLEPVKPKVLPPTEPGLLPAPSGVWKSQNTTHEYRVRVENDVFYAEWTNIPPDVAKHGAYIRTECRRAGTKWIGTSRILLPCAKRGAAKSKAINACRIILRFELNSISPERITGRAETLKDFDCEKCEVRQTGWGDFVWVPKR
jgi:hypothetical protein